VSGAALFVVLAVASVRGQQGSAPPLPMPTGPDTTTATFGDWTLRCRLTATAQTSARSCELVQSIVLQGQTAPFAQLAIGRLSPGQPLFITAVLPTNITFPSTVRMTFDDKDTEPADLGWTRRLQR